MPFLPNPLESLPGRVSRNRAGEPPTAGAGATAAVQAPLPAVAAPRRPQRNLALALVDAIGHRIRQGTLSPGDKLPPEAAIMGEFGVSRTVVREALSMLQAQRLVATRHGIGTFVLAPQVDDGAASFRVTAEQVATLRDVVAVLEVRIALESEAASLAAARRSADDLQRLRAALDALSAAMARGEDAAELDFRFHLEIARASHNEHFANLMGALGTRSIPRARVGEPASEDGPVGIYLRGVQAEHESIYEAIAAGDQEAARGQMRMHLVNSRERRRRAADRAEAPG